VQSRPVRFRVHLDGNGDAVRKATPEAVQ
jgi:hypothetical protein